MSPILPFRRVGRRLVAASLAASLALGIGAAPAFALDDVQRKEFESVIRDYLLKNPEVIQEAIGELQKRQAAAADEQRKQAIAKLKPQIFDSPHGVVVGNPKGDVTLVEFFDYNCGYCKRSLPDLVQLIESDPKLKVVLKEFPVLGPGSVEAAQVAVGVKLVAPEKYLAFHKALLGGRGQANKARALEAAAEAGIDRAAVEKAMTRPEVNAALQESMQIADALGIDGTPSYVAGDAVIVGAVGHDQLKGTIDAVRSCGKAAC
ncbi:DsbA family protein [Ancylobacter oerskovii]|uniref:DsbA family protein n=1 Tax=Ancylobacter oerskovii TaxID=459519 RepID=A0ABW4Z3L1_9HYPH|nr:DsbA family protein [Ancylobacter oerskovii]MBS7545973.1 thioredoxin domain-containing protein [Ancylobacter oerskovii]